MFRLLFVDDYEDDALLAAAELRRAGIVFEHKIVKSIDEVAAALTEPWSAVISDYNLGGCDAVEVLRLVRSHTPGIPFIVVSGTIGEERAVDLIRAGASDYVSKDRLIRLSTAVERELREAKDRHEKNEQLLLSERRLAEAQEIARVGSWTHNVRTGQRSWSDELFRLHGFEVAKEPPPEHVVFAVVDPDDRDGLRRLYDAALQEESLCETGYRVHLPGGKIRQLRASARLERDSRNEPWQIVGVAQDVTEAKEREKELQTLALQHAAAANLGQLALGGASTEHLFTQATTFARYLLHGDACLVLERVDSGYRCIAAVTDREIETEVRCDVALAEFTVSTNAAVLIEDVLLETRFDTDELCRSGMRSGVMIPLSVGFTAPWGVFAVYSRNPRNFTTTDADFLRSLAPVLGQAVESEKARRALQASEENYRSVVEGATEIIFTISSDNRFVSLNPAFGAITGLDPSDWIGRDVCELIAPQSIDRVRELVAKIRDEGVAVYNEPIIQAARGEILLAVNAFPRIQDGRVTAIYGFARDISESRRAELERQRLTRKLELLLHSTAEGIYTIDTNGRCTLANRSMTTLLGWSADELMGANAHEFLHARTARGYPLPPDECSICDIMRTGNVLSGAAETFWRKDGTPIPVQYSAAPIVDGDAIVGVVVTFIEVSERRKLEARLEQATRLSSLGRLAATVAHEFNNVLMGISPFVEVLRRKPSNDRADLALDQITRSVRRGKGITEEILRFTQPADPARSALDAVAWIRTLTVEAASILPPTIALSVELPTEPLFIHADASQLHQVFMNLVLNARDAVADGGTIRIRAERPEPEARYSFGTVERPHHFAHFIVSDTGCGIAPETLQHVFEPLFTTKKNGTGLGLAVTHQVVQKHDGEIFIESEEDKGTAFHLFIPLASADSAPAPALPAEQRRRPRRLLLVEDDSAVAAGLVAILATEDIEVEVAESGAAALASLASRIPDAVVLDVGLPDMDGARVYTAIAAMHPSLPVVFSTGHGDQLQLETHLARRHVRMLRKPYDAETLLRELEIALDAAAGFVLA